jgi:hypothetical protein
MTTTQVPTTKKVLGLIIVLVFVIALSDTFFVKPTMVSQDDHANLRTSEQDQEVVALRAEIREMKATKGSELAAMREQLAAKNEELATAVEDALASQPPADSSPPETSIGEKEQRLAELGAKNEELASKVAELESTLQAATVPLTPTAPPTAPPTALSTALSTASPPEKATSDPCRNQPKKLDQMMVASERQLLESFITPTTRYFEWGSGGSTDTYSRLTHNTVVSIENYRAWCDTVSSLPYVQCRQREGTLVYKCIVPYPTKEYGYPVDPANNDKFDEYINAIKDYPNFDVVLVDARWRVACALKALEYIRDDTVVLLHDLYARRVGYADVFKWYDEIGRAHSLVAMRRKKNVPLPDKETFYKYKSQPSW